MFESILNPIFNPLISLSPLGFVLFISFVISLIIVIVYKLMTKQDEMKALKDETKRLQNEMKTLKDNPTKIMEIQKIAMQKNMEYMKHSMKPTLITFIPIIIIFGWLNANLAYEPVMPNQEFIVSVTSDDNITIDVPDKIELVNKEVKDNQIDFKLKGQEGSYLLDFKAGDEIQTKDILITNEQKYKAPVKIINDKNSKIKKIEIKQNKLKVLNLFGWKLGWLGAYIIFSLVFSILLRKVMKVY